MFLCSYEWIVFISRDHILSFFPTINPTNFKQNEVLRGVHMSRKNKETRTRVAEYNKGNSKNDD
jgi:hypothetical protein